MLHFLKKHLKLCRQNFKKHPGMWGQNHLQLYAASVCTALEQNIGTISIRNWVEWFFLRRLIPWSTVGGGEKWRKGFRTDNCESSAIRDFTFMRDLSYLAALLLCLRIKRFRKFGQIIFFRISHRLFSPFATFSNLLKFFIFPFAGQLPLWSKWSFESRWLFRDKPVGWMFAQI